MFQLSVFVIFLFSFLSSWTSYLLFLFFKNEYKLNYKIDLYKLIKENNSKKRLHIYSLFAIFLVCLVVCFIFVFVLFCFLVVVFCAFWIALDSILLWLEYIFLLFVDCFLYTINGHISMYLHARLKGIYTHILPGQSDVCVYVVWAF